MNTKLSAALAACAIAMNAYAQEPYFVQTFDTELVSQEQAKTETTVNVAGQGDWIFYNTFVALGTKYIKDGSAGDLRMVKSGLNGPGDSYVVTPILEKGVKRLTFDEGRTQKYVNVYGSKDGGTTWILLKTYNKNTQASNTVDVNDIEINRIKLANYNNRNDCDIDNLAVYPEATGTPATVITGEATDITKNSARVWGQLTDTGDQEMIRYGICWNYSGAPLYTENPQTVTDKASFDIVLEELAASHTVYYRAFALTKAGASYGETKSFSTAEATPAVIATKQIVIDRHGYFVTGGTVSDNGGLPVLEQGIIYGTGSPLTVGSAAATKITAGNTAAGFTVRLPLESHTTYYYRAYCTTAQGTSYGEERMYATGDVVPPSFTGSIIWCAPDGNDATADGSENAPFYSLQKAADIVEPGDTIYMKAGTYVYNARININAIGSEEKPIALYAYKGRAVLDFSAMPYHAHSDNPYQGIRLCGSYWHFFGIDITNASDNGLLIERNKPAGGTSADVMNATEQAHHNIIEQCNFYRNGDTGLQMKNLAAYNKVINCDAYLNCDEGQGDADGFAPKISVGDGNYFYGCRAYLNSDDGWDVFFKKDGGFGDNMTIIMENCISYKNGFIDENTIAANGNGNGFKCGSDQGAMNVYMHRCLAVCNKAKGFDQNHNAGDIIMNNCTGMTLTSIGSKAYSYRIYEDIAAGHTVALTNCIAINDNAATDKTDKNTGLPKAGEDGKYGEYGRFEIDSTLTGMVLTTNEFRHAAPGEFADVANHASMMAERNADGSLPETTFAHLTAGSTLIDRGTNVEARDYRGIAVSGIDYHGSAPDLGAYEYRGGTVNAIGRVKSTQSNGSKVSLTQTQSGIVLLTVSGAQAKERYQATVYDMHGRPMGKHAFNGSTTAIYLPQASQPMLLNVSGKGIDETVKIIVR
jgi:hypothetical protein